MRFVTLDEHCHTNVTMSSRVTNLHVTLPTLQHSDYIFPAPKVTFSCINGRKIPAEKYLDSHIDCTAAEDEMFDDEGKIFKSILIKTF